MDIVVVRTGTANLASVFAALKRAGGQPRLCAGPDDVRDAARLMLPGVGAFGAAMAQLEADGLVEPLRERIQAGRPTMCICLGLQLLATASEETPGVRGLGLIDATVARFQPTVRVPQLGWNTVRAAASCRTLDSGEAYFANSYCLRTAPGWALALATHDADFVAAMERDGVLACQFHPELSGAWGAALLARWVRGESVARGGAAGGQGSGAVMRRIIPCLDVRDGRVVKGVRFQGLRDAGDPAELSAAYEAQGADELVVLDVSATPEGRNTAVETVRRVRAELSIPLTVGGGVHTVAAAGRLLDAGADKVSANTAAVRDPQLITDIATRFGSQCAVVAIDAARRVDSPGWEVVVLSGKERTGLDVVAWAREAVARGAGEILLTSWDRDGTRSGYDLDLLAAVAAAVPVPIIASGGADGPQHMAEALGAGADAVLAASIFHEGQYTVPQLKTFLSEHGQAVR